MAVRVAGAHIVQRRSEDAVRVDDHHLPRTARSGAASSAQRARCGVY